MSIWAVIWTFVLLQFVEAFALFETIAVMSRKSGETLSSNIRTVVQYRPWVRVITGAVFITFCCWFFWHIWIVE